VSHGAGIGVTPPPHTAYRSLISRAINCALSLDNSNSESLASVFLCKLAARASSFLLCNTLSTISSLFLSFSDHLWKALSISCPPDASWCRHLATRGRPTSMPNVETGARPTHELDWPERRQQLSLLASLVEIWPRALKRIPSLSLLLAKKKCTFLSHKS